LNEIIIIIINEILLLMILCVWMTEILKVLCEDIIECVSIEDER